MTSIAGRDDRQRDYCQHTETVSILTADIVRVVCKSCRYVSFRFLSGLSGEVNRSRFARTSEHRGAGSAQEKPPLRRIVAQLAAQERISET